ncbi:MAG: FAD-binding oxidoreductase [Thermomicrobiales bacterium]|nr:FAD-binding oxidoreductase [Thermomicrobiales bacterium]
MSTELNSPALPATAEAVIIGAGVNGLSAAYQLTRKGIRPVVLERSHIAAGATGKSGALVRAHYTNPQETQLALHSMRIFRSWAEQVGAGDPGFEPVGFLRLVSPGDEEALRKNVAMQRELGGDTMLVTPDEISFIEPFIRTDDVTIAAYEPSSGFADSNATAFGFARAAEKRGASILTGIEATRVLTAGGKITGVETVAGTISTPVVLLAAGAFANTLLGPLGIDLGLFPRRSRVVIFRHPFDLPSNRRHRVVIDSVNQAWIAPVTPTTTLIGVTIGDRDGTHPSDFEESVEQWYIDAARETLARRFPAFAHSTMRGGWTGVYMQSPDGHPIVDKLDQYDGLFVMTGDSGTSFKTSPAIGQILAEWIADGEPKLMDMTPFRASRFAEGQPWVDAFQYGESPEESIVR